MESRTTAPGNKVSSLFQIKDSVVLILVLLCFNSLAGTQADYQAFSTYSACMCSVHHQNCRACVSVCASSNMAYLFWMLLCVNVMQLVTCDSPAGRLGLTVCYDLRFPEVYQTLTWTMGAKVLLVPSAFTKVTGGWMHACASVRASSTSEVRVRFWAPSGPGVPGFKCQPRGCDCALPEACCAATLEANNPACDACWHVDGAR